MKTNINQLGRIMKNLSEFSPKEHIIDHKGEHAVITVDGGHFQRLIAFGRFVSEHAISWSFIDKNFLQYFSSTP